MRSDTACEACVSFCRVSRWILNMTKSAARKSTPSNQEPINPNFDWDRIAYLVNISRAMDHIEETELVPSKEVLYQFSARGHDVAQIMLGSLLNKPNDAC